MNSHQRRLARLEATAPPAADDQIGQLIWQYGNDVRTWPDAALDACLATSDPVQRAWLESLSDDERTALIEDRPIDTVLPAGVLLHTPSRVMG